MNFFVTSSTMALSGIRHSWRNDSLLMTESKSGLLVMDGDEVVVV